MKQSSLVLMLLVALVAASVMADSTATAPRGVIPFVGSTVGADGPQFSMSLRLYGKEGLRGVIVFHPNGQVANNRTDPTWRYTCGATGICFDGGDIVHAMVCPQDATSCKGAVGSLEIFPDAGTEQVVPTAVTRLFVLNDAAPGGIAQYGTIVPQIDRDEWQSIQGQAGATRVLYIPAADPNFRRNVGLRTLTDISYTVYTRSTDGFTSGPFQRTLPANFTMIQPVNQFVGRPVADSDDVWVTIDSGSAISFYTYTHNYTNEPTLVVGQPTSHNGFVVNPQN